MNVATIRFLLYDDSTMQDIQKARDELLVYTNGMVLPNEELMNLPWKTKLMISQITPEKVLKKWPLWVYVPIGYIERCLNFVSNFDWGLKVQREFVKSYENKNWKTIHDARCLADFYIVIDWKRIERSCYWTRQMYWNPAVSDFAVLESARSIATKSFADTLGIESDNLSKEFDDLRKQREKEVIDSEVLDGFTTNTK